MSRDPTSALVNDAAEIFERLDQVNDALRMILTGEGGTVEALPNALKVIERELGTIVVDSLEWGARRKKAEPFAGGEIAS
jgi:hypothetical protein